MIIFDDVRCGYCGETQAHSDIEFEECSECDFVGHPECVEEHYYTTHEADTDSLSDDDGPKEY